MKVIKVFYIIFTYVYVYIYKCAFFSICLQKNAAFQESKYSPNIKELLPQCEVEHANFETLKRQL